MQALDRELNDRGNGSLAERADMAAEAALERGVTNPVELALRRRRAAVRLARLALVVVVVVLWQWIGGNASEIVASSPLRVLEALRSWAASGRLWADVATTLEEVVLGYVIGAASGVVLGNVLATSTYLADVIDPFIIGLYGIPKIALGPLLVVWLGIDQAPKVALAAVMTFFVVFYSTYEGVRNVDPAFVDAARLMGGTPFEVRRYVILPASWSSMLVGLKMGGPEALVGAIVGEFITSSRGVGYEIQFATSQLDTAGVFAGLIVLTALSLLIDGAVNRISVARRRGGK